MKNLETVESSLTTSTDPIVRKQREDVAKMRTSLLCCTGGDDAYSVTKALKNITILRIYHQMARIIRYTEMMDKLEAKMYESIDSVLENASTSSSAWMMLLSMQEKLQTNMINSQKLLQPYIDMLGNAEEYLNVVEEPEITTTDSLLSQTSRDKLRLAAQSVLATLDSIEVEDER